MKIFTFFLFAMLVFVTPELLAMNLEKDDINENDEQDETCFSCLESLKNGEKTITLPCKLYNDDASDHTHHRECLKQWHQSQLRMANKTTCPTCETIIPFELVLQLSLIERLGSLLIYLSQDNSIPMQIAAVIGQLTTMRISAPVLIKTIDTLIDMLICMEDLSTGSYNLIKDLRAFSSLFLSLRIGYKLLTSNVPVINRNALSLLGLAALARELMLQWY